MAAVTKKRKVHLKGVNHHKKADQKVKSINAIKGGIFSGYTVPDRNKKGKFGYCYSFSNMLP